MRLRGFLHMLSVQGFILAGGGSRRMGQAKSQLELGGATLVQRIAAALAAVGVSTTIVAAHEDQAVSSLPIVLDKYKNSGALGGLHAALSVCKTRWAAVVACDLPFVTGSLLNCLAQNIDTYDAVVPLQADGRRQPLCALYNVDACLMVAGALLEAGDYRVQSVAESVHTRWVGPDEYAQLDGAGRFFLNLNTWQDFENAREIVDDLSSAGK
jgi:molybdenum cofactor guanylyltransferase